MAAILRVLLAAAVLALLAPAAHAGTKVLISAPVSNEAGGISCTISNLGKKAVTLTALETVGDANGTAPLIVEPVFLEPGDYFGRAGDESFGYCRFTLEGSTKGVRAAACRFEPGTGPGTNLDCLEAR